MNHSARLALLAAALLVTPPALALGLGEARVASDLSSPLSITIPISDLAGSGVDPQALRAEVPSYTEHAALGLADPILPRGLRVELLGAGGPGPAVRLRTSAAVREPALRFLLRLAWPGGSVLREYALILDPPWPLRRPGAGDAARAAAPAPSGLRAPAAPGSPRPGSAYGPVPVGDTLAAIVRDAYPGLAAQRERVMRAIVARNPSAFAGADASKLLAGATLQLPPLAELISAATAPGAALRPAAAAARPPPADPAAAAAGDRHTVRPGDTLYSIARALGDGAGATLAKRVHALFAANPDAFLDGDPDRLRAGAVLQLPGVTAAPAASVAATGDPRPSTSAPAAAPAPSQEPAAQAQALRERIAAAEEQTAAQRALGGELRARLDALERQVDALRARDQELDARVRSASAAIAQRRAAASAASQASAAPGLEPAAVPAATAAPAAAAAGSAGAAAPPADLEAAVSTPDPPDPAPAPAAVPAPAVAPAVPAAPATVPERPATARVAQLLAQLPTGWPLALLALLAVALAGALALRLRGRRRNVTVEAAARVRMDEEAARERLAQLRERHAASGRFEAGALEPSRASAPEPSRAAAGNVHLTDAARAAKLAKEAAVHLAYEHYEDARRCIREAIRLDPHRDEHRMMLVTIHEMTGEQDQARAIVDELLARREQLPRELRRQVEQLHQRRA